MHLVVALLRSSFGLTDEIVFSRMCAIHEQERIVVAIFKQEYEREILSRFNNLDTRLPNPVMFRVVHQVELKKSLYVDAGQLLLTEPRKFPPRDLGIWPLLLGGAAIALFAFAMWMMWNKYYQ